MFKKLETRGNPWGQNASARTAWIDEMDIEIPVFGQDVESFEGFDYLFWVGCAGAYEDRAKKTTKAVAELLDMAAVNFLVLGQGETCTGDSAGVRATSSCSDAGAAEHRDDEPGVRHRAAPAQEDRRHLRPLLQRAGQRVPAGRRHLRGRAPPSCSTASCGEKRLVPVAPRQRGRHLPRPVLPGPPQQSVRRPT